MIADLDLAVDLDRNQLASLAVFEVLRNLVVAESVVGWSW